MGGRTLEEAERAAARDEREARKLGFFAAPVALKAPDAPWYAQRDQPPLAPGAEGAARIGPEAPRRTRESTARRVP